MGPVWDSFSNLSETAAATFSLILVLVGSGDSFKILRLSSSRLSLNGFAKIACATRLKKSRSGSDSVFSLGMQLMYQVYTFYV